MEVSCPECGHGLWAEEVLVADRYGVWARIDDEQRSDSYAEHLWAVSGAHFLNARTRIARQDLCAESRFSQSAV